MSSTPRQTRAASGIGGNPARKRGRAGEPSQVTVLGGALVAVAFLVPFRSRLAGPAGVMEEGFMLLLPHRVAHGEVMYRDFHYLWGPLGLWLPALVHSLFGWTLLVERITGQVYGAVFTFTVWWAARRWSELAGVAAGAIIAASANSGDLPIAAALALGALCIVVGAAARGRSDRWSTHLFVAAGVLGGAVALFRPEQIVGVVAALAVLSWGQGRRQLSVLVGLTMPMATFALYALAAGVGHTFQDVVVSGFYVRSERQLPIPPRHSPSGLILFLLVTGSALAITAIGVRRIVTDREDVSGRLLTAVGLMSICLLPEVVQRDDVGHMAIPLIAVAFLPAAIIDLSRDFRLSGGVVSVAAVTLVGATFAAGTRLTLLEPYLHPLVTVMHPPGNIMTVTNRGRSFVYPKAQGVAAAQVVAEVESLTRSGQRLFVGPLDLRRTPYADNSIAVLLPQLTDSMSFPDMHPRVALDHMNRLAADVRAADVLVLSDAYQNWDEPDQSRLYGSDAANEVVRSRFCTRGTFGPYTVLTRCH